MMEAEKIENLISWMNTNIDTISYGEIAVKFIIHDRQIKRIEKTLTEREQPPCKCENLKGTK